MDASVDKRLTSPNHCSDSNEEENGGAVIKSSLSDLERSESNNDDTRDAFWDPEDVDVKVKLEIDANFSDNPLSDDGSVSVSTASSVEEKPKRKTIGRKRKKVDGKKDKEVTKTLKELKRKRDKSPKPKRPRGRRRQPRRLCIPEGAGEDYTSEEEEGGPMKGELQIGIGYPVEFKMKVLKYAEKHSTRATSEKFGLNTKRVREWILTREKIEEENQGIRRQPQIKTDRFTVAERLQAVEFASERSISEARLLYNVDRRTIGKWKAQKKELEASVLRGEGCRMTQAGAGRPRRYAPIEQSLRDWIVTLRLKGVTINYKMILNKAKELIDENPSPSLKGVPAPRTWSWVQIFLTKYNLQGLLGNVLGQEDQRDLLKTREDDANHLSEKHVEIPENPNMRNRRTISLEDKVSIIRRIEQGETQGMVAKSLKVATSTVQTIWSCRHDILRKYDNPKVKTKSDALVWKTYSAIGTSLRDWLEQRSKNLGQVDYGILMNKAVQLSETYKLPEFNVESKQWLRVFCKKNNLADVLAEVRSAKGTNNTGNDAPSTSQSSSQLLTTTKLALDQASDNNVDVDDHHTADFNLDDYLESAQNDTHKSSLPPVSHYRQPTSKSYPVTAPFQGHLHCSSKSSENINHQKISVSGHPTVVTTSNALESVNTLRSWIHLNYGPQEEILNNLLSGLENAVLRKQLAEMPCVAEPHRS